MFNRGFPVNQALFNTIFGFLRTPFAPLKKLNVGIIILAMQAFLWINADVIYGATATAVKEIMLIYLVLYAIFWASAGSKEPITFGVREKWGNFLIVFFASISLFIIVSMTFPFFIDAAIGTSGQFVIGSFSIAGLGFGLHHGFVKAYIEESIFRDALPLKFGLGDKISNLLFGLFHFGILTLSGLTPLQTIIPVAILILLGLFWAKVRNQFGILGSTASHWAWNIMAMGALPVLTGTLFMAGV